MAGGMRGLIPPPALIPLRVEDPSPNFKENVGTYDEYYRKKDL
jgi:hypothetical protein